MERENLQSRPTAIVVGSVGIAGFLMGSVTIGYLMNDLGWGILLVGACASLLSMAAIKLSLRISLSPRSAVGAAIGLTIAAATLCSPISFVLVSLFEPRTSEPIGIIGGAIFAFLIGLVFTLPLGIVFSIAYAPLVGFVHRATRRKSHESLEVTIRDVGYWLGIISGLTSVAAIPLLESSHLASGLTISLVLASFAISLLGAFAAVIATRKIVKRRTWFSQVLLGLVPGWSVLDREGPLSVATDIAPLFLGDEEPEGLLVQLQEGQERGAYRTAEELVPVARV